LITTITKPSIINTSISSSWSARSRGSVIGGAKDCPPKKAQTSKLAENEDFTQQPMGVLEMGYTVYPNSD